MPTASPDLKRPMSWGFAWYFFLFSELCSFCWNFAGIVAHRCLYFLFILFVLLIMKNILYYIFLSISTKYILKVRILRIFLTSQAKSKYDNHMYFFLCSKHLKFSCERHFEVKKKYFVVITSLNHFESVMWKTVLKKKN